MWLKALIKNINKDTDLCIRFFFYFFQSLEKYPTKNRKLCNKLYMKNLNIFLPHKVDLADMFANKDINTGLGCVSGRDARTTFTLLLTLLWSPPAATPEIDI